MFAVTCTDPAHATNTAQAGWTNSVLATSSVQLTSGVICQGCAAYRTANPPIAQTNAATIQANIQTHLGQVETWLAANPNGAVLTAAQTAQLARMLVGVGRILLNLTSTIGQA